MRCSTIQTLINSIKNIRNLKQTVFVRCQREFKTEKKKQNILSYGTVNGHCDRNGIVTVCNDHFRMIFYKRICKQFSLLTNKVTVLTNSELYGFHWARCRKTEYILSANASHSCPFIILLSNVVISFARSYHLSKFYIISSV